MLLFESIKFISIKLIDDKLDSFDFALRHLTHSLSDLFELVFRLEVAPALLELIAEFYVDLFELSHFLFPLNSGLYFKVKALVKILYLRGELFVFLVNLFVLLALH